MINSKILLSKGSIMNIKIDKKDDVILIQKYKGNYYNVPNDNNELEISED